MRISSWLLVVVAVLSLFPSSDALAYECWVCEDQLAACLHYRSQTKLGCDHGCGIMWPTQHTKWLECLDECKREYDLRLGTCYAEREECYLGCPESQRPKPEVPKQNCPIVIDLASNGMNFTEAVDGVSFDIDGDGRLEPLAWTDGAGDDAFLALDRDGNGRIDSGRELFGNHTEQPPSDDPHGFLALAVFDGNGDGLISAADGVFGSLLLWTDRNHNGVSEAEELESLGARGVVSVSLDFKSSRRRDPHGNMLRYRSGVELEGKKGTDAVDVFFRKFVP